MKILFRYFTSTKTFTTKIKELEKKISNLETQIKLVKQIKESEQVTKTPTEEKPLEKENHKEPHPTITVQHLHVESIIIQKVDYANNFGQLGIRDLSGKLNIGTSYEGNISKEVEEKIEEKVQEKLSKMAKVHFRPKKEEE
jgi:cell division septum initiation protein DivIVA